MQWIEKGRDNTRLPDHSDSMTDRKSAMQTWLDSLGYRDYSLDIASEDASFRRYFRIRHEAESFIIMDAPPDKEPCDVFVQVATKLRSAGLNAPEIIHENHAEGFLVLTDFGDRSYLHELTPTTVSGLYADAIDAVQNMQSRVDAADLPAYDEALLRREMGLFHDWFVHKLLGLELGSDLQQLWQKTMDTLTHNALQQPQVFVHRDFHSRNLMYVADGNPGILDFQDAVRGPVSYDLVSLLRDCYVDWPPQQVEQWVFDFHAASDLLQEKGIEAAEFMHWFNLMGAQRHLKAVGIFSRLKLRDGKDKFLRDIPRTLNYLLAVSNREPKLNELQTLINRLDLMARIQSWIR